jgi:hypothetical protein
MQLPLLPTQDGALLVDNTMLEIIAECWAKVKWNRLYKRIQHKGMAAPDFGSVMHEVLNYRYSTVKDKPVTPEVFQQQSALLSKWFSDHPVDEFERRNENLAIELLKKYNQKYQTEPFNVLQDKEGKIVAEYPFAIPLYTARFKMAPLPVIFTGKIDLPVLWEGSKLIVIDHKTDSMYFGPQRFCEELRVSNQFRGYAWAFEKASGQKVDGFCINGIPTKEPPAKPKQGLDNWWNDWLVRELVYLDTQPSWREEWFSSTVDTVDSFLWHYERESFPATGRFVRACTKYGGCHYLDVCGQASEEAKLTMLESGIFVDNLWSPLQQKQTTNGINK